MRKTKIVEWAADVPYRFTLKTVTVAGDLRRADLLTEGHAWFAQRYGIESQAAIDEYRTALEAGDVPAEVRRRFALLWKITDWASVMASLDRVEVQRGGEWQTVDPGIERAALSWQTYEAFAEDVPQELFVLLAEAAHEVNPFLWRIAGDDDAKKNEKPSGS